MRTIINCPATCNMNHNLLVISRRDAAALGRKRFYTGEPCLRGHDVERFVSNGGCTSCQNIKTPTKPRARIASNQGWPASVCTFVVDFTPLPEEIAAAFRYAEWAGWLAAALKAVHEDPKLLEKFGNMPTAEDEGRAMALLNRAQIIRERAAGGSENG